MFSPNELNFLADYYNEYPTNNQIKFAQGIQSYFNEYPYDWPINIGDLLAKIILMPPYQFSNLLSMLKDFWQMEDEPDANTRFDQLGLLMLEY